MIAELQSKNDTQILNTVTLILTSAFLISGIGDAHLWVPVVAGVGLCFVLAYLITMSLFLDACRAKNDRRAETMKILAANFHTLYIALTVGVLVLLVIYRIA